MGFEHNVRKLAQALEMVTKNVSLGDIIEQITSHQKFKFLKLTAIELKRQKYLRNWLGHSYANTKASQIMIQDFEKVIELNQKLIDAKKWVINDRK